MCASLDGKVLNEEYCECAESICTTRLNEKEKNKSFIERFSGNAQCAIVNYEKTKNAYEKFYDMWKALQIPPAFVNPFHRDMIRKLNLSV